MNGKDVAHANGTVRISPDAKEVRLSWTRRTGAPNWSYNEAAQSYKTGYRRRYDICMHGRAGR